MTGLRARLATLTMLGLVAAGAFALASGTATASQQSPILECVFHDTGTGQYNSLWGYSNNGSTTTIAIGASNNFSPTPQNRGPADDDPGRHARQHVRRHLERLRVTDVDAQQPHREPRPRRRRRARRTRCR